MLAALRRPAGMTLHRAAQQLPRMAGRSSSSVSCAGSTAVSLWARGSSGAGRRLALGCLSAGAAAVACRASPTRAVRAEAAPADLPAPADFTPLKPRRQQSSTAFFFEVLLPDLPLVFFASLASMGAAWSNVEISKLLGGLSDSIVKLSAQTASNGTTKDQAALVAAVAALTSPALALLKAYAIQGALSALYISVMSFIGERLARRLRERMYAALLAQDIGFFDEHRSAELTNRLTSDVQDFKSAFKSCCSTGLKATTQLLGSALALYQISPNLTGLMLTVVGGMVMVGTVAGKFLRNLSRASSQAGSEAGECAEEVIANVRTVRSFVAEGAECARYEKRLQRQAASASWLGVGIGLFQGASNVCINAAVLLVLHQGGAAVLAGELSSGNLTTFLVSTQQVQRALAQLSVLFGSAVKASAAGGRLHEYASLQPNIETPGGKHLAASEIAGRIELKDVTFTYPTRPEQKVLDRFNLTVEAGQTVALCGASGSGKSTTIGLVERFYDPAAGTVTLDGHDITSLDLQCLRGSMSMVSQEPRLFAGSVAENIAYGKPGASRAEVEVAARSANAHDFIVSFPDGYDTQVGAAGTQLSGGQKQRVAIARAIIKNPAVLLLDEATSALDNESEKVVQRALDALMAQRQRTTIVIAHRLSTIRGADKIVVVEKGKVVEEGTHVELMAKRGAYSVLQSQGGGAAGG